jgi:hypothetical protein
MTRQTTLAVQREWQVKFDPKGYADFLWSREASLVKYQVINYYK